MVDISNSYVISWVLSGLQRARTLLSTSPLSPRHPPRRRKERGGGGWTRKGINGWRRDENTWGGRKREEERELATSPHNVYVRVESRSRVVIPILLRRGERILGRGRIEDRNVWSGYSMSRLDHGYCHGPLLICTDVVDPDSSNGEDDASFRAKKKKKNR